MQVRFALLCDHSNDSLDGKLNVMGITDTVYAYQFPANHRESHFIASFYVTAEDYGRTVSIDLHFIDEDGNKVLESNGVIQCPDKRQILNYRHILHDLRLTKPGTYQFSVFIDGRQVVAVPLQAVLVESQKA